MSLMHPPPVPDGGTIYVTHVAGAVQPQLLAAGIALLRERGFRVLHDEHLGESISYLAGSDAARAADFRRALETPGVDAVIAARGGYGTMRILPLIGDIDMPEDRWLVGYSDVTALHAWANAQGVATIHGPMVSGLGKRGDGETVDRLIDVLQGRHGTTTGLSEINKESRGDRVEDVPVQLRARGRLAGGNLSLVCAMLGTQWMWSLRGRVVLLEEVGEPLYRLDRMLTELALRTSDGPPAAVVLGQFTRCGIHHGPAELEHLLRERAQQFACPVVYGAPFGHGDQTGSIVLGAEVELDLVRGTLELVDTALEDEGDIPKPLFAGGAEPPEPHSLASGSGGESGGGESAELLAAAVDDGVFSGVQLDVSIHGEPALQLALGRTGVLADVVDAAVTSRTLFDIASVTKAVSTAVLAWRAVELGLVTPEDRIPSGVAASGATLLELLNHSSGLPAYDRVYPELRAANTDVTGTRAHFAALQPADPAGASAYSDPGYIQLGLWLEALFEMPLDQAFDACVAQPLSLRNTVFSPVSEGAAIPRHRIVATEYCEHRGSSLQGVVHDEHAQLMGGVAGHAGLFSTAREVSRIVESLLGYGPAVLKPETVDRMWDGATKVGSFLAGWDSPSGPASNAGSLMSAEHTVGHLGFTGTSVWADRSRGVVITLLTNRVHPSRNEARIRKLRPALHDAVMTAFFG